MATVVDNVQLRRYEVVHDGALAGHAEYQRSSGSIMLTHTVIDDVFAGKGLASTLIKHALNDARGAGVAVLPHHFPTKPHLLTAVPEARDRLDREWPAELDPDSRTGPRPLVNLPRLVDRGLGGIGSAARSLRVTCG